jgi:hypothetical protein
VNTGEDGSERFEVKKVSSYLPFPLGNGYQFCWTSEQGEVVFFSKYLLNGCVSFYISGSNSVIGNSYGWYWWLEKLNFKSVLSY